MICSNAAVPAGSEAKLARAQAWAGVELKARDARAPRRRSVDRLTERFESSLLARQVSMTASGQKPTSTGNVAQVRWKPKSGRDLCRGPNSQRAKSCAMSCCLSDAMASEFGRILLLKIALAF